MMMATEMVQTNTTQNQYSNHEFRNGFTTILPLQIREVKFIFHEIDVTGLVLCTILNVDNIKIIDREIMDNKQSYQLSQFNNFYIIQPAGKNTFICLRKDFLDEIAVLESEAMKHITNLSTSVAELTTQVNGIESSVTDLSKRFEALLTLLESQSINNTTDMNFNTTKGREHY